MREEKEVIREIVQPLMYPFQSNKFLPLSLTWYYEKNINEELYKL